MTDSRSLPKPHASSRILPAIALIALGGAGGFLAYKLTASHKSTLSVAPLAPGPAVVASQTAAPAEAARQIPEVLPDIELADRDGVRRRLSDWKGRPLMVNFWATWCGPCRREIPLLETLRRQHSAEGVEVIGIAVDFRDAVLQYAREMHIDYPLLIGEQDGLDAVAAFGMETVFPFTVFADRQGRVVTLKVGELHADEAALILARLQELERGRLTLPAAREAIAAGIRELAAHRLPDPPEAGSQPQDP